MEKKTKNIDRKDKWNKELFEFFNKPKNIYEPPARMKEIRINQEDRMDRSR